MIYLKGFQPETKDITTSLKATHEQKHVKAC